jgi:hypothetical protein
MKEYRGFIIAAVVIIAVVVLWYVNRSGPGGPSPQPSASAPAQLTKKFAREGLAFEYPDAYRVEVAADDPNLHQIAIDSPHAPGVLTIRYNPSNPTSPLDLDTLVSHAKQGIGDGVEATVKPTRLKAAGRDLDGRELKSKILGFPFTDNVFSVQVGSRHYAVLTHVADEDKDKARVMFDKVLSTLSAQ